MEDLERAISILETTGCTCTACKGDTVYRSIDRGVKPLLCWLDSGTDMMGFSCCDRVVGKGAAFLYCLLGVRRVHGKVMSLAAVKVFRANGIEATWDSLVEAVQNRTKTGPCPIENACLPCTEPEEALEVIRATLEKLQ